jgi:ATP/maltotriose-dependent transcriptional regulator MalT
VPNAPLVVLSKLTPPLSASGVIARERVDELLQRSDHARLILLIAPAGYGKTTAATVYRAARRDAGDGFGWVSLDIDDRDPSRFLAHVIGALQTAHGGIGIAAQSLLATGNAVPIRSILLTLFNEVATVGRNLHLVLDDFYRCGSDEILALVDTFLESAPANLRLILTSREMPELSVIPRLRARDQLVEIRAEHLRFQLTEACAFLNDSQGLDLEPPQVRALHERTDGWVTGLQLAALSLRDRHDRARFIDEFSGSHRDIVEYLAGDVLANLPTRLRGFLQETAILERLSASLCDAVTDSNDSAEMLAELERANMFMLPLDNQRSWYRYHHLFADFLRRTLRRERPEVLSGLHRRAYRWYAANDMIGEAVGHAIEAGDWERTAEFVESGWLDALKLGRVRTIIDWIERLPKEVSDRHPQLHIALSWTLALQRDYAQARQHFRIAAAILDAVPEPADESEQHAHAARLSELRTAELLVYAFSDSDEEMLAAARDEPGDAVEYDPFVQGVHDNLLVYSSYVAGDFDQARRYSVRARERHLRADGIYGAVYTDCFRGLIEVSAGALDVAETFYERGFSLASERLGRLSVPAALPGVLLAEMHYLRNRLDNARAYVDEFLPLVDQCAILDAVIAGHYVLAQLRHVEGRDGEALDLLAEAEALGNLSGFDRLVIASLAQRARLLAKAGDFSAAEAALRRAAEVAGPRPQGDLAHCARRHRLIDRARAEVLIAQGQPELALEILKPVLEEAAAGGRVRVQVDTLILKALAWAECGDERAAIRRIGKALALSAHGGVIRNFVDEGQRMKRLLLAAHTQWTEDPDTQRWPVPYDHLVEVLTALGGGASLRAGAQRSDLRTSIAPNLSGRELEVLKALFVGRSNKEIARQLGVAESTVAWHLKNIYSKLNVTRRTEAVAAALAQSLV